MVSMPVAHAGENMELSSTSIVEMEKIRFILRANITFVAAGRQSDFRQPRIKSFNLRSLTSHFGNLPAFRLSSCARRFRLSAPTRSLVLMLQIPRMRFGQEARQT